jgi:hypothetical protein
MRGETVRGMACWGLEKRDGGPEFGTIDASMPQPAPRLPGYIHRDGVRTTCMDLPSYGFDVQERSASAAGGRRELPKGALWTYGHHGKALRGGRS